MKKIYDALKVKLKEFIAICFHRESEDQIKTRIDANTQIRLKAFTLNLKVGSEHTPPDLLYPSTIVSLSLLEDITNEYIKLVPWVFPVDLVLFDPENARQHTTFINEFELLGRQGFTYPVAAFEGEVYEEDGAAVFVSTPRIVFFKSEFQSIGVLLHELAHMRNSEADHGDLFQEALNELISVWDEDIKYKFRGVEDVITGSFYEA